MIRDPARLEALRRTALLDTPAEERFDRITRLTSRALRASVTLLSLVDAERQFFKSSVGLPKPWASRGEIPVSQSLCQHVVLTGTELRIEDSRSDPRFQGHPAAQHGVIAYAGVPSPHQTVTSSAPSAPSSTSPAAGARKSCKSCATRPRS